MAKYLIWKGFRGHWIMCPPNGAATFHDTYDAAVQAFNDDLDRRRIKRISKNNLKAYT